ncbi:MAG: PAS domain S-box protein, partial [Myxococcales bacterium]
MTRPEPTGGSERVLVLMPSVRDAERTAALLRGVEVQSVQCASLGELCREVWAGAGAVLTTEEVVLGDTAGQLAEAMRAQPTWSAMPVLVLAREGATEHIQRATSEALKSLLIVERPVRTRTLLSVVLSALRSRRNQYEIRDAILAREQQASVLRAQEEKLRFVQAAGGLGAWDLDLASEELETSPLCRAAHGRGPDEAFSYRDLQAAIHPDDRARVEAAVAHSLATGDDYDTEYRVVWPDGQVRWLLVRGRAAHDGSGRAVRMAGITLDITERKSLIEELQRSQSELREQDRRKDEFLATLAHELRNPLAPIRTGLEVMRQLSGTHPATERAQGIMERQLGHMVRLIDDLLDVSRISRGKVELRRERVSIQ